MRTTRTTLNWVLLTWLWTVVGLIAFLMCVQFLMLLYAPKGTWHLPRIYKVTVRDFTSDPQEAYATIVTGKNVKPAPEDAFGADSKGGAAKEETESEGDKDAPKAQARPKVSAKDLEQEDEEEFQDRTIALQKSERKGLNIGDELWVLDNYHRSPLRAPQFRLTPTRLLIEFPEPLLVLALLAIFRIRKTQAKAEKALEATPRERVVLRDDFHERANRFHDPKA